MEEDDFFDAFDDVGEGAGAVGAEDFDGYYGGFFGYAEGFAVWGGKRECEKSGSEKGGGSNSCLPSNRACDVGTMSVPVPVIIAFRNGLAPSCALVEVLVVDLDTSVHYVTVVH